GVEETTGQIDYDRLRSIAKQEKPKLIICGASSYSRDWNFPELRKIADEVGALLLADIAHTAGLIASKLLSDPMPYCHIITTTTHKTLRGPRGGMILIGQNYDNPFGEKTPKGILKKMSAVLDFAVFPGTQGGPLMHVIAAKAVAFGEALTDDFRNYSKQVIANAKTLASEFIARGYKIVSGGTDNHLMLIDLRDKKLTGKAVEDALGKADITVNKNMVPFDNQSPMVTSGIRIGTPAVTTRGLKEPEMIQIAAWIDRVIQSLTDEDNLKQIKNEIHTLISRFPLNYPQYQKL
ncbi:MAG: serine hydroxymethyltransferase, partial [Bacteroidia bacterium]|nr:serine hydroxymethyltransferase [Bacteroidia bacterium]